MTAVGGLETDENGALPDALSRRTTGLLSVAAGSRTTHGGAFSVATIETRIRAEG